MDKIKKIGDIIIKVIKCLAIAMVLGGGIFLLWSYLHDTIEGNQYRENGSQTTATVTRAINYSESGGGKYSRSNITRYSDFTIEYTVDGEDYVKRYKRHVGTYKKGETLTVYYLDSNPGGEVIFFIEPPASRIIGGIIFITAGVGLFIMEFNPFKRFKKQKKINNA